MSNFLWETSWHGRNLQTSADYWDTQYFLFWQKFHDQSFCSDCEKTEHESTFLKLSVDSAWSIDFKNGLIFENCQFNSWPMSKNLYNWFLSCTFLHVTFLTSDHFFLIILVKILIFSCKKSVYVEIQLLVLLKFWLSLGLMKKEKKNIWLWLRFELGTPRWESGVLATTLQRLVIEIDGFIEIYVTLFHVFILGICTKPLSMLIFVSNDQIFEPILCHFYVKL